MERMTRQQADVLLLEAEERFPRGTRVISAYDKETECLVDDPEFGFLVQPKLNDEPGVDYFIQANFNREGEEFCIWYNGEWAQIAKN